MSTTNDEFEGMAKLFDISTFTQDAGDLSTVTKGSATTFRDQRVTPLHNDAEQSTVYVAATGPPYLLGMTSTGSSFGSIWFSQYGSARVSVPPAHSIDLSALQQPSG